MIQKERIVALDVLRGVSIAGILIMNIQSFSMPSSAYLNPDSFGNLEGWNRWVWILSHILASGKFLTIFSILFGAGVMIFIRNAESRGENFAAFHFRRMGWLLLFGMMHAYLLWHGDILVAYSLCGMLIFFFRNTRPAKLLRIVVFLFLVPMVLSTLWTLTMPYWPPESLAYLGEIWNPDIATLQSQLEAMRGGWLDQMKVRAPASLSMQTTVFIIDTFWRVSSMMLLGMFLLKREVLTAKRSRAFYIRMCIMGLSTGYLLSATGVWMNFKQGWSLEYSMFLGAQFNYLGSAAVALGYIGGVMLIVKSAPVKGLVKAISAVGRTAFSNYIFQTLVCTAIFYGHGLGLFGSVERKYQILIVVGVWMLQLLLTTLWFRHFRQGPLEYLWRRLSYS